MEKAIYAIECYEYDNLMWQTLFYDTAEKAWEHAIRVNPNAKNLKDYKCYCKLNKIALLYDEPIIAPVDINASLLTGGNNLTLRGDTIFDTTMDSNSNSIHGVIRCPEHVAFVREAILLLPRYFETDIDMFDKLVSMLDHFIDYKSAGEFGMVGW